MLTILAMIKERSGIMRISLSPLFIFVTLVTSGVQAQKNDITSYHEAKDLTTRSKILNELWNDLIRSDIDTLTSISYLLIVDGIKNSDEFATAVGKRAMGSGLIRAGQTTEGIRLLDEAGKYFNGTEDFVALTEIYNEIGNGYNLAGQMKKAEKYYLMSLDIGTESPDPTSAFLAKVNLAQVYISVGKYEKAIRLLQDYKDNALKSGKLESVSNSYSLLGTIEQIKGNLLLAKEYFEKSIRFGFRSGSLSQQAQAYNNLAIVHFYSGSKDSVLHYFNKSLLLREKTGNMKSIAESYMNLGEAYLEFGNFTLSESNYKKAIQVSVEAGLVSFEGELYGAIAELYSQFDKKDLAIEFLQKQIEVMDTYYKQQFDRRSEDNEAVTEIRKMEFDRTVQQAYEESNSIGLKDILKYGVIGALLAGAIMFASMLMFRKKTSST
jgi:tetratricopeptide (TPR) repeat protein